MTLRVTFFRGVIRLYPEGGGGRNSKSIGEVGEEGVGEWREVVGIEFGLHLLNPLWRKMFEHHVAGFETDIEYCAIQIHAGEHDGEFGTELVAWVVDKEREATEDFPSRNRKVESGGFGIDLFEGCFALRMSMRERLPIRTELFF